MYEGFFAESAGKTFPFPFSLITDDQFGLRELRKTVVRPIEMSRINDDAANRIAMPGDPLGGRMNDNIRSEFDWTEKLRGRDGVVDDKGNAMFVRKRSKPLDIGDFSAGVGYGFRENRPCMWCDK